MAKTRTPLHSIAATGVFAGVVAAVTRRNGPHYLRRPPRAPANASPAQLAIRNAWAIVLAALRFASMTTNPQRPYASGYAEAWRALSDGRNTWANHAQARLAVQAYENNAPVFPVWQDMTATQRAAWNAAAAQAVPPLHPIKQHTGTTPPTTTIEPGLALLIHEFAAPYERITNPPDADYPPMYRADAGPYTRALWDYNLTPWDGDAYLWDNRSLATWADVPAPIWDAGLAFWDAR